MSARDRLVTDAGGMLIDYRGGQVALRVWQVLEQRPPTRAEWVAIDRLIAAGIVRHVRELPQSYRQRLA